jgi:hypothetical protein
MIHLLTGPASDTPHPQSPLLKNTPFSQSNPQSLQENSNQAKTWRDTSLLSLLIFVSFCVLDKAYIG